MRLKIAHRSSVNNDIMKIQENAQAVAKADPAWTTAVDSMKEANLALADCISQGWLPADAFISEFPSQSRRLRP
jgi:hypothetical protein